MRDPTYVAMRTHSFELPESPAREEGPVSPRAWVKFKEESGPQTWTAIAGVVVPTIRARLRGKQSRRWSSGACEVLSRTKMNPVGRL